MSEVCLDILNNDSNLGKLNHMLKALIPKVKNPTCVENFRPISLCSVIYKLNIQDNNQQIETLP